MLRQSVAYNCTPCATNEFSLEAGSLEGGEVKAIECITDCPYGGDCSQGGANLAARSGFFGARNDNPGDPPTVKFVACPSGFCCEDSGGCAWDDTCAASKRTGDLCGRCRDGHSVALLSTSCVPTHRCRKWLSLLPLELVKTVGYTLLFYYQPSSGFASPFALVAFYDQIFNVLSTTGASDATVVTAGLGSVLGSASSSGMAAASNEDEDEDEDDDEDDDDDGGIFGVLSASVENACAWPGMQPLTKEFTPFADVALVLGLLLLLWVAGRVRKAAREQVLLLLAGLLAVALLPMVVAAATMAATVVVGAAAAILIWRRCCGERPAPRGNLPKWFIKPFDDDERKVEEEEEGEEDMNEGNDGEQQQQQQQQQQQNREQSERKKINRLALRLVLEVPPQQRQEQVRVQGHRRSSLDE
jgi:hypothetical protein